MYIVYISYIYIYIDIYIYIIYILYIYIYRLQGACDTGPSPIFHGKKSFISHPPYNVIRNNLG